MLVLSRRVRESLVIELSDNVPETLTARELFSRGTVEITVLQWDEQVVRLGIGAPVDLKILRAELCQDVDAAAERKSENRR